MSHPAAEPIDGAPLDLPRRIDHTLGEAREVHARLKKGPFRNRRRRARRQLARMVELLGELQRWTIAQALAADQTRALRALLDGVDVLLHDARHEQLTKPGLKRLRRDVKRQRHAVLAEWSALDGPSSLEPAILTPLLVHEDGAGD